MTKVKIKRVDAPISVARDKKTDFGLHGSSVDKNKVIAGRRLNDASLAEKGGMSVTDATDVTKKHIHSGHRNTISLAIGASVALVTIIGVTIFAIKGGSDGNS